MTETPLDLEDLDISEPAVNAQAQAPLNALDTLKLCRKFAEYAELHFDKDTKDGDIKAKRNQDMVNLIYDTFIEANAAFIAAANPETVRALIAEAKQARELRDALEWYGEQSRLCRLIHSEGDAGRAALASDGGEKAIRALAGKGEGNE